MWTNAALSNNSLIENELYDTINSVGLSNNFGEAMQRNDTMI